MSRLQYAGAALATLLLAACAGQDQDPPSGAADAAPPDPAPVTVDQPAPEVDVAGLRLPFQLQGLTVVDPGWDQALVEADGTFLGLIEEEEGSVRFRAIDSEGTIRWEAQRSAECTAHALSRTGDGTPVVVLSEREQDSAECSTARAYEWGSGAPVWGPTVASGPLVGPGLTFGPGDDGAATVLDAETGEPVPPADGARSLGEFFGTALSDDGATLTATARTGARLWSRDLPRAGGTEVAAAPGVAAPELAAVGSTEAGYDLISLTDGRTLAAGVTGAATDPTTGFTVATGGVTLQGLDPEGERAWSAPVDHELSIHAAGGALVYLSDGDGLHVHNVTTGAAATGYDDTDGTLATPELLTATGAGVVRTPTDLFLVTTATESGPPPTE